MPYLLRVCWHNIHNVLSDFLLSCWQTQHINRFPNYLLSIHSHVIRADNIVRARQSLSRFEFSQQCQNRNSSIGDTSTSEHLPTCNTKWPLQEEKNHSTPTFSSVWLVPVTPPTNQVYISILCKYTNVLRGDIFCCCLHTCSVNNNMLVVLYRLLYTQTLKKL